MLFFVDIFDFGPSLRAQLQKVSQSIQGTVRIDADGGLYRQSICSRRQEALPLFYISGNGERWFFVEQVP